jgi:dihydrodipicolinate synthase/N-acetylneuraminate lyase
MGVAGVKAAMDRVGLRGGRVRAPLLPLGADDEARVDALLRDARVSASV